MNDLSSKPEYLLIQQDEAQVKGIAILIDRVSNPLDDCKMEILAITSTAQKEALVKNFFERAKPFAQAFNREIQWGFSTRYHHFDQTFIQALGLNPIYDLYDSYLDSSKAKKLTPSFAFKHLQAEDLPRTYECLCESFGQNLETSIPSFESWKHGVLNEKDLRVFTFQRNGRVLGFVSFTEPESRSDQAPEIRLLGALPERRKNGLGQSLLSHAIQELLRKDSTRMKLTVAASNERALSIYLRAGFEIVEVSRYFRTRL